MTIDIYPSLHFLPRPGLVPQAMTVARSGTATRIDARGFVEAVAADTLRHDFDPLTGAYLGWLIEEPRTNLALHARDLTEGAWTKTGISAVRTQTGADGAANGASALTASVAGATITQVVTAASAAYTFSVDLKRMSGSGPVSITLDGGATWQDVTAELSSLRFTRVTRTQTVANPAFGLKLATAGDVVIADYAQLEAGAFATSRIPTGAGAVARGGDVCTLNAGQNWFNPAEGTVYVEAETFGVGTTPKNLFSSKNDPEAVETSVDDPTLGIGANVGAIASSYFGGASPSGIAVTLGQPFRIAMAYSLGGGALVQGGTVFQQWAVGSTWLTSQIAIGAQLRDGPKRFLNGHVRHFAIFPRRLSNAQAVELTTL